MIKILIVEQNESCRHIIKNILQDYAHIKQKIFSIDEAMSGTEAVMLCSLECYDLIYTGMDLQEMSGIETTKLIRANSPNTLIVAVSKENIEIHKKVLFVGADDYMLQPINKDLFNARLDIYLSLIKSRRNEINNLQGHTLYTDVLYARTTAFFIKNQDVLAEFWEYYVFEEIKGYANVSNIVMMIYDIGLRLLELSLHPHIWIEESERHIYFTINKINKIDSAFLEKIISRHPQISDYFIEKNKISFKYARQSGETAPIVAEETKTIHKTKSETKPSNLSVEIPNNVKQLLKVYDYMDEEHLENIKEYIQKLNSLLLLVGSDIEVEEVEEIAFYLDKIGKSTSLYNESYSISRALSDLSSAIEKNTYEFISKSSSLGVLCSSFGHDLTSWVQMTFYGGAPSVDFMDDTIVTNSKMLESMLSNQAYEDDSASLDDIFDF